jgi:hypothetical protein
VTEGNITLDRESYAAHAVAILGVAAFNPGEVALGEQTSIPASFCDSRSRRVYSLMAAHLFVTDGKRDAALAWRIRHAYEAGVIGAPSKWRFAASELSGDAIPRTERETSEIIRALAKGRLDERRATALSAAAALSTPPADDSMHVDDMANKQIEELTGVVAGLLATVAAQHREIEELRERLDAATIARVQTEVTKLAQDHQRALFAEAREVIGAHSLASGEMDLGEVEHKGSVTVRLARNVTDGRSSSSSERSTNAQKVDVAAEIRGLAARIASVGVDVGVETSKIRDRTEVLEQSRTHAESQHYEGMFETRHRGQKIRWSR